MTKDFFKRDPLFLAPLAGFSDPPLRGVVKKFGCDATVSEMISANALVFEGEKTLKMLEKNVAENPIFRADRRQRCGNHKKGGFAHQ